MNDINKSILKISQLSLIAILFLFAMNLSAAENFYDNYSDSERLVIAGAYLAVSEQYTDLEDPEKAEAYKNMADQIFPGIEYEEFSGTEDQLPVEDNKVTAAAPMRPSGKEPGAVRYFFSKLLRAAFSENRNDIESLLSTKLYLPAYDNGISKADVMDYVDIYLERYELDKVDPNTVYNTKRVYIKPEGSAWVASIDLTDMGEKIFTEELGFSGSRQNFYFREYREGWRLIAINSETVDAIEDL